MSHEPIKDIAEALIPMKIIASKAVGPILGGDRVWRTAVRDMQSCALKNRHCGLTC